MQANIKKKKNSMKRKRQNKLNEMSEGKIYHCHNHLKHEKGVTKKKKNVVN